MPNDQFPAKSDLDAMTVKQLKLKETELANAMNRNKNTDPDAYQLLSSLHDKIVAAMTQRETEFTQRGNALEAAMENAINPQPKPLKQPPKTPIVPPIKPPIPSFSPKEVKKDQKLIDDAFADRLLKIYRYIALPAMGVAETVVTKGKKPGTTAIGLMGQYDAEKISQLQRKLAMEQAAQQKIIFNMNTKKGKLELKRAEANDKALDEYQEALGRANKFYNELSNIPKTVESTRPVKVNMDIFAEQLTPGDDPTKRIRELNLPKLPATITNPDYAAKRRAMAKMLGIPEDKVPDTEEKRDVLINNATRDYLRKVQPLKYQELLTKEKKAKERKELYKFGDLDEKQVKQANTLRGEYNTQLKQYDKLTRDTQKLIATASAPPSAANDYALIYMFNKVLDENSVVRESEFQNTANIGSLAMKVMNWLEALKTGKRIQPSQRQEFKAAAIRIMKVAESQKGIKQARYRELSAQYGIDFRYIDPTYEAPKEEEVIPVPKSENGMTSEVPGYAVIKTTLKPEGYPKIFDDAIKLVTETKTRHGRKTTNQVKTYADAELTSFLNDPEVKVGTKYAVPAKDENGNMLPNQFYIKEKEVRSTTRSVKKPSPRDLLTWVTGPDGQPVAKLPDNRVKKGQAYRALKPGERYYENGKIKTKR